MNRNRMLLHTSLSATLLAAGLVLMGASAGQDADGGEALFSESRIYWEYNSSANDLGVHVSLDGEDWKKLRILKPDESLLFQVKGAGPYEELGMTELFFEGAEPSLEDFPLADLLALFPEGEYEFEGITADDLPIEGESDFTHAIPDGPHVKATVGVGDSLVISWDAVTGPPPGFPAEPIVISGYQVIVESFQVTLPPTTLSLTVSPEFVASLPDGHHVYEVLAIEQGGNQTLREGRFDL
jgi:hypothetical protein